MFLRGSDSARPRWRVIMHRLRLLGMVSILAAFFEGSPALGQTFNSGSTGVDGAFAPTSHPPLQSPPSGVLNSPTKNIPAGITVTFARNKTNTPVTMLAGGNVVIAGTVDVSGGRGGDGLSGTSLGLNGGPGGPGGFDG